MHISINCFADEQLRSMIENAGRKGKCDILLESDTFIYDTEDDDYLADALETIFSVFTPIKEVDINENLYTDDKVSYMRSFLARWKIFSVAEDDIQKIIVEIGNDLYEYKPEIFLEKVTVKEFFQSNVMKELCILETNKWQDFCCSIKYVNRFHTQMVNFIELNKLLSNMEIKLEEGSLKLYRSRICDEEHYNIGYKIGEMGAPPLKYASVGRTNSEGIPCLYLADKPETTFHEVRARDKDHVSVGEFVQKDVIRILDLSQFDKIGPFSVTNMDMTWFAVNIEIIRQIGDEISKPMRRFDSSLDYIPTQYICDYIKYLGYDGIKFKSTLCDGGVNYAMFSDNKFECKSVSVVSIETVNYKIA